jgi:ferredoxin
MNELMMPVGVFFASATWEWLRQRSAHRKGALEQAGSLAEERVTAAAGPVERAEWGTHEVTFRTRAGASTVRVAGQTLLRAAREAKLPLPSRCERGVCGTCKVRVCDGAVDPGAARALSEQERAAGYVLACVARPASAATVDLEPERES